MRTVFTPIVAAVALFGLAACSDSTATQIADDASISQDVAASSGDAASTALGDMAANETSTGLSDIALPQGPAYSLIHPSYTITVSRTRTCYDANHVVVAGCSPMSSVRTIVTHVTDDGSRSGTNSVTGGATVTWSGAQHRVSNDSLTRVFTGTTETSRIHNDLTVDHDTTSFSNGTVSRTEIEAAHDSVEGVTFAIPRTAGSTPTAGKIVRIDSVHVVATKGSATQTRDVVRVVTITFPADANGNVTITVTGGVNKTCTYNVVSKTSTCG